MDLSAKNAAYKSYIEQAKEAYSDDDIKRARVLFLKAAEITNQIANETSNRDIKEEYHRVTKIILEFVKVSCVSKINVPADSNSETEFNLCSGV